MMIMVEKLGSWHGANRAGASVTCFLRRKGDWSNESRPYLIVKSVLVHIRFRLPSALS